MLFAAVTSEQTSLNTVVYWAPRLFYLQIHAAVKLVCLNNYSQKCFNNNVISLRYLNGTSNAVVLWSLHLGVPIISRSQF
jgi:hypothetical protein